MPAIRNSAQSVLPPAKINLSLEILGRRADGYHEVVTVFQTIDLCDRLTLDWDFDKTELVCDDPSIPGDESNSALRAVRALEARSGSRFRVRIALGKRIPAGAGLGGGSSDAAAVLLEVGRRGNLPFEVLQEAASSLGADVPFFLKGKTALGKGKGESLEFLPELPKFPVVVVKPAFSILTAAAYAKISSYSTGEKTARLVDLIKTGKHDRIFDFFTNDFEAALFPDYPRLKEIKETFLRHGALAAQLSGSGSAVFAFARDSGHAEALSKKLQDFGTVWITST